MNRTRLSILFLVLALGMFSALSATVSTYVFSQSTGTYSEITGGTVLGSTTSDDQRFVDPAAPLGSTSVLTGVGLPIGFGFTLDGNTFNRFAVNYNGWISLGQSALTPSVNITSSANYPAPLNSTTVLTPTYLRTRIAGFAQDLQGQTGSELSYLTIGTAPNQILVVQWKGVKRYSSTVTSAVNFQIRLYEGLNKVEVIYGNMTNNYTLTAWNAQAGLGGSVQADYNNRTSLTDWTATTPGAAATAVINYSSTIYPPSGLTFAWSMPSGPPVLAVIPEAWDFGTVVINATATKVFTLTNSGGGTITINSVTPSGLYYDVSVQPTDLALAAGESTPFTVSYSPLVGGGPFTGTVTVNYTTDATYNYVIDLTGASLDPTITDFPHPESFDAVTFPPLGWTNVKTAGTGIGLWDRVTAGSSPTSAPHSGAGMLRYNSFSYSAGTTGILVTPPVSFGTDQYIVSFWMYRDTGYPTNADLVNVHYNTASNLTGATLLGTINRSTTLEPVVAAIGWYLYSFTIPAADNSIGYVIFEAVSAFGNNMFLDDIVIGIAPAGPGFSINPESHNFGQVELPGSATQDFVITNTGGAPLLLTSVEITDGATWYVITVPPAMEVAPGLTTTFTVVYTPTAAGPNDGTIAIFDNTGMHLVPLWGEGYTPPPGSTCDNPLVVTLPLVNFSGDTSLYGDDYESNWIFPNSYYLGGDDMVLQFTLAVPSTLSGVLTAVVGTWIGMFVVNTCPDPVTPALVLGSVTSSGTVATLAPLELPAGTYFLILSTWPAPQSFTFSLDLTAVPLATDPVMTISEMSWNFGQAIIGSMNNTPHTFTATNTGQGVLTIAAAPSFDGVNPTDFTLLNDTNVYPIELEADESASWTVQFAPGGTLCGPRSAFITIMDNLPVKYLAEVPAVEQPNLVLKVPQGGEPILPGVKERFVSPSLPKAPYPIALSGHASPEAVLEDYFETYADFTLDLSPWTQLDMDLSATYGFTGITFPNQYYTGSYIIFNPDTTTPIMTDAGIQPYSGDRYAACFAATTPANNDWLITPQLLLEDCPWLSFFARSYVSTYGLERFNVGISTTGTAPQDFTMLNGANYLQAPTAWTLYEYDLAAYAGMPVYIGIQCVSFDAFIFMLDDFIVGDSDGTVPVELSSFAATLTADLFVKLTWISQTETNLTGYRVYRNTTNNQATAEMLDHAWIPATNTSTTQVYNHVDDDVLVGSTYYYWLESVDYATSDFHGPVSVTVENNNTPPALPTITSMKNAYPNPFRTGGNTNIEIALKAGETGTFTVYNILGQVVRTLTLREGSTTITWDGRDSRGNSCTSGLYFYKLHTPSVSQTRKLVLVK